MEVAVDRKTRDLQEMALRREAGKLLRGHLALTNTTQDEVGRLIEVSQPVVSSWLRGDKPIPRERIEDLARELPSPPLAAVAERIFRLRLGGVLPEHAVEILARVREIVGGEP